MGLILDTNALSALMEQDKGVVGLVSEADMLAVPVIVAGEFSFGIAQSRYRQDYERALRRLLDRCTVLPVGIETVRFYAAVRLELKRAGTPIPSNDVWIAALARQYALPIVTRDAHFTFVTGLQTIRW